MSLGLKRIGDKESIGGAADLEAGMVRLFREEHLLLTQTTKTQIFPEQQTGKAAGKATKAATRTAHTLY